MELVTSVAAPAVTGGLVLWQGRLSARDSRSATLDASRVASLEASQSRRREACLQVVEPLAAIRVVASGVCRSALQRGEGHEEFGDWDTRELDESTQRMLRAIDTTVIVLGGALLPSRAELERVATTLSEALDTNLVPVFSDGQYLGHDIASVARVYERAAALEEVTTKVLTLLHDLGKPETTPLD